MAFETGGKLGKLVVEIAADLDKLDKDLSKARGKIDGFAKQTDVSLKRIAGTFLTLGSAVGVGMGLAVKATLDYNEEIFTTSKRTGIATETLSKLKFVADQTESSFEALATGFKFLNKNIFEAANGNDKAAAAFEGLNIQVKDNNGQLITAEKAFFQIADKIANTRNEAEKAGLAMQFFGRNGTALLPVLNLGSKGIQELSDRAEKLGLVLTKDNAEAIDKFDDSVKELRASIGGVALVIGNALIPFLSKAVDFIKVGVIPIIEQLNAALIKTGEVLSRNQIDEAFSSADPVLADARKRLVEIQTRRDEISPTPGGAPAGRLQQQEINELLAEEERLRALVVDRMNQQNLAQQEQGQINEETGGPLGTGQDSEFFTNQLEQLQQFEDEVKNMRTVKLEQYLLDLEREKLVTQSAEQQKTEVVRREIEQRGKLRQLEVQTANNAFQILSNAVKTFAGDSKAAAIVLKVLSIGQAIVNTAVGVTTALRLGPVGIPIAKVIAVLGAIQVATIAATGFAQGSANVPGGGGVTHEGEIVVPETFADAIRKGKLSLSATEGNRNTIDVPHSVVIERIDIRVEGDLDNDAVPGIMEQMGSQLEGRLRGAV